MINKTWGVYTPRRYKRDCSRNAGEWMPRKIAAYVWLAAVACIFAFLAVVLNP